MHLDLFSARRAVAVDISSVDHVLLQSGQPVRGIYVGGTGDLVVKLTGSPAGAAVTFSAIPAGTFLPLQIHTVVKLNTTASLMVAVY